MIYVTCGSSNSIGLEVFFKSLFLLPDDSIKKIDLIINKNFLINYLEMLNYSYSFQDDTVSIYNIRLKCTFVDLRENFAIDSLSYSLDKLTSKDVLFTLPAVKSDFIHNGKTYSGHTEYFRSKFTSSDIFMIFKSKNSIYCLLSDHIPVIEVNRFISHTNLDSLYSKIHTSVFNSAIEEIYFSGFNPHCGEGGLIGNEDGVIIEYVESIKSKDKRVIGTFSADTIHFFENNSKFQCFIFNYHDQALGIFKSRNGLIGSNISLGLPFLRVSVDHGTGPDIFGKNIANPLGCFNSLKDALAFHSGI